MKLTKAQRELLGLLGISDRQDIVDERVVKALARVGLAKRFVERHGHLASRHCWRITPAGRAALTDGGNDG